MLWQPVHWMPSAYSLDWLIHPLTTTLFPEGKQTIMFLTEGASVDRHPINEGWGKLMSLEGD